MHCIMYTHNSMFPESGEATYEVVETETSTNINSSAVSSAISTEVNEAYLLTVATSMETDVTTVDSNYNKALKCKTLGGILRHRLWMHCQGK